MLARLLAVMCATAIAATASVYSPPVRAEVTAEKSDDKVTIKIDGKLFTEYLTKSGSKPILWPVIGPTGAPMTRSYPMEKVAGEATDHVHQRSFWFTHGNVNGIDFWSEGAKAGKQNHKEFVRVEGGRQAIVITRNDWVAPDGKKLLQDERQLTFFPLADARVIDFDITLTASADQVTFGDTKEGSFGIRIAETARPDRGAGRILNSEGQVDDASTVKKPQTWGKRASWVDYSGPVKDAAGKKHVAGITILNHPASFRFPTYWHVRTYGLFAANPFGVHDFEGKSTEEGAGNHTLKQGQTMRLKYRVILHAGLGDAPQFQKMFDAYTARADQASAN
ncbi:MAG: PmoA family protein [Pirellulales bacterium]